MEKKLIIWTDKEKQEMSKAVDYITNFMVKSGFDKLQMAYTIGLMNEELQKEQSIEMIKTASKNGILHNVGGWKRIAEIMNGMHTSDLNVILWSDDEEVKFQLYFGLFLQKKTYIICLEERIESVRPHEKHPLIKEIIILKEWNEEEISKALEKISEGVL